MTGDLLKEQVGELLARHGHAHREFELLPCGTGGNNRVMAVVIGSRKLIAKWYFSHASDSRDRLGNEFGFLSYANRIGISCVPTAIACDPARQVALYEYIEGTMITADQLSAREVTQALEFFLALNRAETRPQAASLPAASEACFTLDDHLATVDGRIERLLKIDLRTDVDRDARLFVGELEARWKQLKTAIVAAAPKRGIAADVPLTEDQRCISPSDFGFHNALRRPSGDVCFLDFEYAGWDDPAKMAGDFFSHPAVSVDHRFREQFVAGAMSFCGNPQTLVTRAELLFPVFQTKWCCIILNDFLADSARRRKFADPTFNEPERKRIQLAKATSLFGAIHLP